jgi:predicted transcriptional regulator
MNAATDWIPGLGPLESAIMTVIWDTDQSLSVRVVRERLDYLAAHGEEPVYTTVMTVMVILWRKGFLQRAKCPGLRAWCRQCHGRPSQRAWLRRVADSRRG